MTRTPTKINNLQALRAFAAVLVVFFHTGYAFPHISPIGEYGVDIFFVLSGYIMARICDKNPQFFFRRRLIRILPPYWTLTILLFVFSIWFPELLNSTRPHVVELIKSLFFIPFAKDNGLIRPILFVGWSLNYEMFFYLLISLSLLLLPRRPMLLATSMVVAAYCIAESLHARNAFIGFLQADFILEFPLGALAYFLARQVSSPAATRTRGVWLLLLFSSIAALNWFQAVRPPINHHIGGYCYDLLATFIVFSTSLLSQGGWDTQLTWLILIGDASYVLYLVHPYCEYFIARVIVPHLPWLRIDRPFGCIVAICFSVTVGLLLHLYAERPVLALLNERFGGHRKSAEFGVVKETQGTVQP